MIIKIMEKMRGLFYRVQAMLITTLVLPLPSLIKCRLSFMIEMGLFQQHLKKEWRIEMGGTPSFIFST